ncbi:imm11 family protein [Pleionea sp. CnH1-48]|uniref:imm11 family protein n=1 Tax=Pleionea sp. CnH1-48 TaxID=2954494 RepID=UPI0020976160|nr:DUF1629 domain-containing protein [Pleionea sp. CnH1-48]MCO7225264.1 hypothetical protein [Pleionea sp. CnH1-48]
MEFLRWSSDQEDGYCVLDSPLVDDESQYLGEDLHCSWPDDVTVPMDDDYPEDIELVDNPYGSIFPIVSQKIVDILAKELPEGNIEFLPVTILNHKGHPEPDNYFILHPKEIVDCIDQEASVVEWNPLAPEELMGCESMVLNEDKIPPSSKLFRLKHWGSVIIIRSDLAELLESEGVTGLYFPPAKGYNGVG